MIVFYAHDGDDHDDVAGNDDDDDDDYHHHCDHQNLSDVTEGQFNKTFTSVIYKCSCCFQTPKTMATFVNYFCKITCNSVIKLAPAVSFVFHVY